MRSLLCASRNNDLLRFEFLSSHLAGFRPAGSHCEKSGKSDDTCASARSGCAKQRSLLCPLSERRWRHPLLFAVLDLLVLLDQAKSTEERKCTTEEIDSSGRIPTRRSAAPYLGVEVCGACPQRRASAGGGFGPRGAPWRRSVAASRSFVLASPKILRLDNVQINLTLSSLNRTLADAEDTPPRQLQINLHCARLNRIFAPLWRRDYTKNKRYTTLQRSPN